MMQGSIGVIIARFQVPELHNGHNYLILDVMSRSETTLILLGTAPFSERNPLSFELRKAMIQEQFSVALESIKILPLPDCPGDDQLWSDNVNNIINVYTKGKKATIYGSRGSFIPHYKGGHDVVELEPAEAPSGTEIREGVRPINSIDFRKGVIWASRHSNAKTDEGDLSARPVG